MAVVKTVYEVNYTQEKTGLNKIKRKILSCFPIVCFSCLQMQLFNTICYICQSKRNKKFIALFCTMCRRQLRVSAYSRPSSGCAHQPKNTVHEGEVVYSDEEISFILHISCYLLRLKVGLVVLGFGCGIVDRIGRCCILLWVLSFFCSVSPVLCFLAGACYRAGVWVNLAVCCITYRIQRRCHTLKLQLFKFIC